MQTDQQPEANAVFLQTLTGAVSDLKNRLQQDYDLSSFPHLLLPDLVEAHMERLGLQPADTRHNDVPVPHGFGEIENYQPALAYVDC
jgi:hypothetical protein